MENKETMECSIMEEVSEMRRKISAEFGHDLNHLWTYYQELEIEMRKSGKYKFTDPPNEKPESDRHFVEKDDLTVGLGQCVAEMHAAQRFNAENGNDIPRVYGATTSGTEWLFLKLEGQRLYIDTEFYSIHECDKILGILASMVEQKA